jgi:alkylhydroperoxidase/carboxymuconolactone decarboxylase family protein YurZ
MNRDFLRRKQKEATMKYSKKYFAEFEKRYPDVAKSFDQLGAVCAKAGPIDRKTQRLIKLGAAVALGHEGNVQNLTTQALADGMSSDEIRHAVLLTTTTAGFPTMMAAMQWVEEVIAAKEK